MTLSSQTPTCIAFDGSTRIAAGPYIQVALALKAHSRKRPDASVLVFDTASGRQIDFDLSGSDSEIVVRLAQRFPGVEAETTRAPGRPKLGVVAREVTLLPRHWEWLAAQPGGSSVTLRKLIDEARRSGPSSKVLLRKLHERTYHFMSAIAGDFPNFEEASRALFADNSVEFRRLIADWPVDIKQHLVELNGNDATLAP
jgi:uncharacterized protein